MKTLYESILDVDKNYDNDVLISLLFSKNLQQRRLAFKRLSDLIKSHNAKQHKTTAKMKSSDSYFVEFTHPIKVENGEVTTQIINQINYIQICRRTDALYRTICINASGEGWGDKITHFQLTWRHTQPNFNPKSQNISLYEVPEELNDLFRLIEIGAYNYK